MFIAVKCLSVRQEETNRRKIVGNSKRVTDKKEFGRKVQTIMLDLGWNQSQLARESGIGRDSISGYVRGQNLPNSSHLSKLSRALRVDPSALLSEHAYQSRFPSGSPEPKLKIEQSPDDPDRVNLQINQQVPADVALQIMALIRQGKKSLT